MRDMICRLRFAVGAALLLGTAAAAAQSGIPPAGPPPANQREELVTQRRIRELRRLAIENFNKGGTRLAEAARNLMDLINLRPYVPDYHLALALVFRREGRHEDCYRKLNDVLDLNGPKQIVYLFMAEYHMRRGDKQKALKALGKAAESGMNIMEAVAHLPVLRPLRTDTEFVKLTLSLERFGLRSLEFPQNFRDPFRPSRLWRKVTESKEGGIDAAGILRSKVPDKDEQARLLLEAKAALASIERYLTSPRADDTKAMQTYRRLQALMAQRSRITVPRIAREFDAIARKLGEIETKLQDLKLRFFWQEAEGMIAKMRSAFEATEYAKVEKIYEDVKKLADEMVKASKNFRPAAQRVMQVADYWRRRAQIRSEFAKKELKIVGIVTSEIDGKRANFVILNKKLLREGDAYQGFLVEKIERNRVTVRYKGERIGLVFRRY